MTPEDPLVTARADRLRAYGLHAATAALLAIFAFLPAERMWALDHWAYFPRHVPVVLFAVALFAPHLLLRIPLPGGASFPGRAAAGALLVTLGTGFVLFRARTHFLGDGYQNLARLAGAHPHPKFTSFGEDWIHIVARNVWPASVDAALATYQTISIVAGVGCVLLIVFFARRLFDTAGARVVFVLGLTSGGWMLLFFGYVESYSLFVTSALATSLTALAILRGQIHRGWIAPLVALTIFLHVLGLLLVPGAAYVLARGSKWSRRASRWPRSLRVAALTLATIVVLTIAVSLIRDHLFLRLAFVPPVPTRFTADGYTLLSVSHLLDFANLVFLMLPGLPLVVLFSRRLPLRKIVRQPPGRYLAIATTSTAVGAFLLDPKLGMPRDWDLYSGFGVHLTLASFWLLAEHGVGSRPGRFAVIAAVVLGWCVLGPRIAEGVDPEIARRRFEGYLALDRTKSMNSRIHLVNWYRNRGDEEQARRETDRWDEDYPERGIVRAAHRRRLEGKLEEAIALSRQALELNPIHYDAYTNLGACLIAKKDFARAIEMLEISYGLNPGDLFVALSLGEAHWYRKDWKAAERWWRRARAIEPDSYHVNRSLAGLYRRLGREREHLEFLTAAANSEEARSDVLEELGDWHAQRGDRDRAVELYRRAIARDLDDSRAQELRRRYPELR